MKYYRLLEDMNSADRWYLGKIENINNWITHSDVLPDSLDINLVQDGPEIDFTLTENYVVPIISQRLKEKLMAVSNIRFVSVKPIGKKCIYTYFAMIVEKVVDCIDEEKSKFEKFQNNDPIRPDMAGQYSAFFDMKIDKEKIEGLDIFRIENFEIAIVVSENIVNKLHSYGVRGIRFKLIN